MIYLHKLLPSFLLPVGLVLLLLIGGLLLRRRLIIWTGLAVLWIASTPLVGNAVIRATEGWQVRQPVAQAPAAQAIVVLSNSRILPPGDPGASEWSDTIDRFYGGVDLYKAGKAPLLVFTDPALPWRPTVQGEGEFLADLAAAMGVPRDHILTTAKVTNTADEARAVADLLNEKGLLDEQTRVLLVTSAFHMRRAQLLFARAGVDSYPFRVDFRADEGRVMTILDFLPEAQGLQNTEIALREFYGLLFYYMLP